MGKLRLNIGVSVLLSTAVLVLVVTITVVYYIEQQQGKKYNELNMIYVGSYHY